MIRTVASWLIWAVAAGFGPVADLAIAATTPPVGPTDPRIRVVAYDPDDVVILQGYVGYQIHIQWAEGEEFQNLGSGDNGAFDIGAQRNHFFIKPKETRASTNLTVLTNKRAYHFDYVVGAVAPTGKAAQRMVYSLRFTYPQDEAVAAAEARKRLDAEARMQEAAAARPRNASYGFCGNPSLKPVSAWDDGTQTHLRFASHSEFPALFLKNDDGSESLLNFNVEQDEVVVHRVARRLVLRRGDLVGCVVNQAFDASGASVSTRPRTNTSVPSVERTTKGDTP